MPDSTFTHNPPTSSALDVVTEPPETAEAVTSTAGPPGKIEGRLLGGGRYRLQGLVGAGSSARVYLAEDLSLGRQVAIKCLRSGLSDDPHFIGRFRAEAQAAAQLAHPNVLAVYDWGEDDATAYLVTEVLLGGSLLDMEARTRLTPSQGLLVGLQVARGLKYAHGLGWVHRDIKPANLLFGHDGRLRIADFGIAQAIAATSWTEPEGILMGTARYAAPEQATGEGVGGKSDVYSLALTIIEAVTGEMPLVHEGALATMMARQTTDVPEIEALGALGPVLTRAGRADPEQRPSAAELIEQLTDAARELPRPEPLPLAAVAVPAVEAGSDGVIDLRDGDVVAEAGAVEASEVVESEVVESVDEFESADESVAEEPADTDSDVQGFEAPPVLDDAEPEAAADDQREVVSVHIPIDSAPADEPPAVEPAAPVAPAAFPGTPDTDDPPATDEPPADNGSTATPDATGPTAVPGPGILDQQPPQDRPPVRRLLPAPPESSKEPVKVTRLVELEGNDGESEPTLFGPSIAAAAPVVLDPTPDAKAKAPEPAPTETVVESDDAKRRRWLAPVLLLLGVLTAGWLVYSAVSGSDPADEQASATGDGDEASPEGPTLPAIPENDVTSTTEAESTTSLTTVPVDVEVPDLVGLSLTDATAALEAAELEVGEVNRRSDSSAASGTVVGFEPSGATDLPPGSTVDLIVSSGPATQAMPSFVGLSLERSKAQARELGLQLVEAGHAPSTRYDPGVVVDTEPPTGTQVRPGDTVEVIVSSGQPYTPIPNVVGLSASEARQRLEAAGFDVVETIGSSSSEVIRTMPPAGEYHRPGHPITIDAGGAEGRVDPTTSSTTPGSSTTTTSSSSSTSTSSSSTTSPTQNQVGVARSLPSRGV